MSFLGKQNRKFRKITLRKYFRSVPKSYFTNIRTVVETVECRRNCKRHRNQIMYDKLSWKPFVTQFTFGIVIFDILTSHRIIGFGNIYAY